MTLKNLKEKFSFPSKKPNMPPDKNMVMGWFTANNQVLLKKYLLNRCIGKSVVIEFGTWLGVSAKFIAETISDDSTLICVDWWKGDTSIGRRNKDEDELYKRYIDNVWEYRKKIIPVRMDGKKAAVYLSKLSIKPDLIYLDMGHSYEEVIADLNVITEAFPNVIIIGDDYLYWPGVKKAVLETRYRLNIPYLDIDKNCYALLYKNDKKYMTYNNSHIGKKVKFYKDEEIQYSLLPNFVNCKKKVFIIPIHMTNDIKLYSNIIKDNKDILVVVKSRKKVSTFTLYNYGYLYFINNLADKDHLDSYTFIFLDPNHNVDTKYYKCIDGLLSITKSLDLNNEVYSSLGSISIDNKTLQRIDLFPNGLDDEFVNRYFLYRKLIDNKLIIYQLFVDKRLNRLQLGHTKGKKMKTNLHKIKSKIKKSYNTVMNKKQQIPKIKIEVSEYKDCSNNIHIIIVK